LQEGPSVYKGCWQPFRPFGPAVIRPVCLSSGEQRGAPNYFMEILREIKEMRDAINSIDVSLQLLSSNQNDKRRTTAFVSKKILCQRLNIPSVTLDKLIHQGIVSDGETGLVEGTHYCKVDPSERNSSKFLFDPLVVIDSAWKNFKNV